MRPTQQRSLTLPATLITVVVALALVAGCSVGSEGATATTTTAAPSTTTTSTTLPPSTTTTLTPTPARKVLLLGDSTMVDASPAIMAMFEASGAQVSNGAGPGFGLTRLGVSEQDSTFRVDYPRLLAEENPDLVVVMLGIWDQFYVEQNGVLAYARVVKEAADILVSQGADVVFLAQPPGGEHPERVQDGAFEAVADMYPGQVFFIDYEGVLRGPDGGYPVTVPGLDGSTLHLRKADGFHFCPDGAERLAAELNRLAVVHGLMHPAEGWQSGSWRSSSQYAEPVCFS